MRHGGNRAGMSENTSGTSCFKNKGYSSEAGRKHKKWSLHLGLVTE